MTSRATASEPSATPLPDDSGNDPSDDPRDARIAELEALIHQLRTEMSLLGGGSGRRTPGYYVDRVARGVYRRIR